MRYKTTMETPVNPMPGRSPPLLVLTLAAGMILLFGLLGLLGWMRLGPDMLLAMAENGLSMCF